MGEKKMGVKNRARYSAKCFILFGFGQEFSFWYIPKNKKINVMNGSFTSFGLGGHSSDSSLP